MYEADLFRDILRKDYCIIIMPRLQNINDSFVNESNAASAGNVVINSNFISFDLQKELLLLQKLIAQREVERYKRIVQRKREEDECLAKLKRGEDERLKQCEIEHKLVEAQLKLEEDKRIALLKRKEVQFKREELQLQI